MVELSKEVADSSEKSQGLFPRTMNRSQSDQLKGSQSSNEEDSQRRVLPSLVSKKRWDIIFTVPETAKCGDLVCCDLPNGSLATATVPENHEPGDRFLVDFPPLPGGRHRKRCQIGKFKCPTCGRQFKKETHLRVHSFSHKRAKPVRNDRLQLIPHPSRIKIAFIAGMSAAATTSSKTKDHHHICVLCDHSFKSRAAYEVHMARLHANVSLSSTDSPTRSRRNSSAQKSKGRDDVDTRNSLPQSSSRPKGAHHRLAAVPSEVVPEVRD